MSAPVESAIGPLKLTMGAVARYANVTGTTLEADLSSDTVGTGAVVRVLWACRQFVTSPPSVAAVADQVEAYLDDGGSFVDLAQSMSDAVAASAWYRALASVEDGVDPTTPCAEAPSPQD